MTDAVADPFKARETLQTAMGPRTVYRIDALKAVADVTRLPMTIKVLLESALRNYDGFVVREQDVRAIASYNATKVGEVEIPFMPGRVVLQDFTGVPAVVDLAAMRDAMVKLGGDPQKVNPLVPCDLVIDHSVQVDAYGSATALTINNQHEFSRNKERYEFLKWGQQAFKNFRVVPPSTGIVHQVNLEYLAKVVWEKQNGQSVLFPDSLVGTDSHTTMINGVGVLGWGVGGIEAEAVMLGQPLYMLLPEVIGFRFTGKLREGVTATDLVLFVTQILRKRGVVEKFVEFFGPGLDDMPVANRATIANMAPEYGATCGFFPVDQRAIEYLHQTGRDEKLIQAVEQYSKLQGLWRNDAVIAQYTDVLELDLSSVEPSLAGPKRPQDRIALSDVKTAWRSELAKGYGKISGVPPIPKAPNGNLAAQVAAEENEGGTAVATADAGVEGVPCQYLERDFHLKHGAVVIAAITSCTNTSNPSVMLAAGLVARKAAARGLRSKPWVKTSLAPGSLVVQDYLKRSGTLADLEKLGFYIVGFGCTTCIGNSGPLPDPISKAINENDLVAVSVLSGNRNFEGRISPDVKANYLASPPLVVAYALTGTIDVDMNTEPLGIDSAGKPVYLREIWPTQKEIADAVAAFVTREQFTREYAHVFDGSVEWKAVKAPAGAIYQWDDHSTYIQNPPFFAGMTMTPAPVRPVRSARVLLKVGDSVTTDHVSPAGSIKKDSPAGKYLLEHGVPFHEFNSYGSRRGNDRVMTRGTFANIRVVNKLIPGNDKLVAGASGTPAVVGGFAPDFLDVSGEPPKPKVKSVFDAAMHYKEAGVPLVIFAGKDYGMGSSRDWAAKGTMLLGVRAVIAESFERIHRSNLVGMGVLPLQFKAGQNADTLALPGDASYEIDIPTAEQGGIKPRQDIAVRAKDATGKTLVEFTATCRIDTPVEVEYYSNGGILHAVLRKMAKS